MPNFRSKTFYLSPLLLLRSLIMCEITNQRISPMTQLVLLKPSPNLTHLTPWTWSPRVHFLIILLWNITSACRYGRTFPKTGLHSGYLMLYEVRYSKIIWVIKNVVPHFPYIIYFPLYYIWLFSILEILFLTFCNTGKSASHWVGNHVT